jgi:glycosyltransferase involved in cell wall biosynthesis
MHRLSIVIPTYNAGSYLKPAVQSILSQDVRGLEVIVVDDGSTDGSMQSIECLPVKIIRKVNGGDASARNVGVLASHGEFITFLDSDDLLTHGCLLARMEYLQHNGADWAVGGLPSRLIDETGEVIADVFTPMSHKYSFPLRIDFDLYRAGDFFPVNAVLYLYRRSVFDALGLYDDVPTVSDFDFQLRVLQRVSVPILGIRTFDRRVHANNMSIVGPSQFKREVYEAIRRVNARYGITPNEIKPWEADYWSHP